MRSGRPAGVLEAKNAIQAVRGDRATLAGSAKKWFEELGTLRQDAFHRAPEIARKIIHKIDHEPASFSEKDVADLKSGGSSEEEIFKLIVGTAAAAGGRRLEAGLRAIPLYL